MFIKLIKALNSSDDDKEHLLKITQKFVPHETCNVSYVDGNPLLSIELPRGIVNDLQICAGEPGKDTCLVRYL